MINVSLLLREPWHLNRPGKGGMDTNVFQLTDQFINFILIYVLNRHKYGVLLFKIHLKVFQMSLNISHINPMPWEYTCQFMHTLQPVICYQLQVLNRLTKEILINFLSLKYLGLVENNLWNCLKPTCIFYIE